jgi:hypothetical protein
LVYNIAHIVCFDFGTQFNIIFFFICFSHAIKPNVYVYNECQIWPSSFEWDMVLKCLLICFLNKKFFHIMSPPKQFFLLMYLGKLIYIMISKGFCFDQCWFGMHFQPHSTNRNSFLNAYMSSQAHWVSAFFFENLSLLSMHMSINLYIYESNMHIMCG